MSRRILGLMGLMVGAAIAPGFATEAHAGISYTCNANVDAAAAGTCAFLNSTVAGIYGSTFTNANANIYIEMANTGLGENDFFVAPPFYTPYSTYRSDLFATASGNTTDTTVHANLPASEPSLYNGSNIFLRSALGDAIGVTGLPGITSSGGFCLTGSVGCFDGLVKITTSPILWWRQQGGNPTSGQYDFYSVVEHETDEVLGSGSCVASDGATDVCGSHTPSATDLFRYDGGNRVLTDALNSTDYFSIDGGATSALAGATYNTSGSGDWADFAQTCQFIQDAFGCPGLAGKGLDITNDGALPEIITLDAIGYNLVPQTQPTPPSSPEPASIALFGAGLAAVGAYRRRRSA